MNEKEQHDLVNLLRRLEIMAELLAKREFTTFSEAEIKRDALQDLEKLKKLFQ